MSSRTSSRSTLTTVPSTMSPSLKYLMVSSMAARKASSEPRSSTVTLLALEVASMLLVMWTVAPNGWIVVSLAPHGTAVGHGTNEQTDHDAYESGSMQSIMPRPTTAEPAPCRGTRSASASTSLPCALPQVASPPEDRGTMFDGNAAACP